MNNYNYSLKNINKSEYNKQKLIQNSFLEMAQKKINNNKLINQNNYIFIKNNLITSSNTNDDIISSKSIISKHNQISDSIEEKLIIYYNFLKRIFISYYIIWFILHFNFINVVKVQEI